MSRCIGEVTKAPAESRAFAIDWSPDLGSATVSTSTWAVSDGVTQDAESETTTTTTIRVSGGTDGGIYILTNTITTSGSETLIAYLVLRVEAPPS